MLTHTRDVVYLAATQQQTVLSSLSGEPAGLSVAHLSAVVFFSPPSCQKAAPASSVSLAARSGKTHEAESLKSPALARKKQQKEEDREFWQKQRGLHARGLSTTTVLYLSRKTPFLNHPLGAQRPSGCLLKLSEMLCSDSTADWPLINKREILLAAQILSGTPRCLLPVMKTLISWTVWRRPSLRSVREQYGGLRLPDTLTACILPISEPARQGETIKAHERS